MELAKQEYSRSRDRITDIYHSQVEFIQEGLRNTSDKQYNLNLALISASIVVVGVVIPLALQSSLHFSHIILRSDMYVFILTFILGFILSIYAPIKDRKDLNKIADIQMKSLGKQLDLIKPILMSANDNTLTTEEIDQYNEDSIEENKRFANNMKPSSALFLNIIYYAFISSFILGLILFIVAVFRLI